jgi:trk system potassium uptake protein TrkA
MRILIAGAGSIGSQLARILVAEKQEVVVVDQDPARIEALSLAAIDCQAVLGEVASPRLLEDLGIRHTDLVLAVTNNDALNLTVCRLAGHYAVPERIARVRNLELTDEDCPVPAGVLGADRLISPEGLTVEAMIRLLRAPGAEEAEDFADGRLALRAVRVTANSPLATASPRALRQPGGALPGNWLAVGLRRGRTVATPRADLPFQPGDLVHLMANAADMAGLLEACVPTAKPCRTLLVAGASTVGQALAERARRLIKRVVLVEPDARLAEAAAARLDACGVEVIKGSPLDEDLLLRLGADSMDQCAATLEDAEDNLALALLWQRFDRSTPLVLVDRSYHADLLELAGIELTFAPLRISLGAILREVRGAGLRSVTRLRRDRLEVLELVLEPGSALTRAPLGSLGLPQDLLIAAVVRGDTAVIPDGMWRCQAGDRALVVVPVELVSKTLARLRGDHG